MAYRTSIRQGRQQGIVLLTAFVFLLLTALAGTGLVRAHQTQMRRDQEQQLLFVGDQFRRAIVSYYNTFPPGGQRTLPPTLEALLDDTRFVQPVHHLRKIYPDPISGTKNWAVIRAGTGIAGVHSLSELEPLKQTGFPEAYRAFAGTRTYAEWQFVAEVK
jgi:type II secretory pathway pseudopilin PulG